MRLSICHHMWPTPTWWFVYCTLAGTWMLVLSRKYCQDERYTKVCGIQSFKTSLVWAISTEYSSDTACWHGDAACLILSKLSLDSFLLTLKQLITRLHCTESWADRVRSQVWVEIDMMKNESAMWCMIQKDQGHPILILIMQLHRFLSGHPNNTQIGWFLASFTKFAI